MDVSVIIPVYNSKRELLTLVDRFVKELTRLGQSFEILLIDDGSIREETDTVLRELVLNEPHVKAIILDANYGKFAALLCGFEKANGRWVLTADDDLRHRPEDVEALLAHKKHEVVIASYSRKGEGTVNRLGSRVKNLFDSLLFGKPFRIRSGPYKLIQRNVIKKVLGSKMDVQMVSGLIYRVSKDVVNVPLTGGVTDRESRFSLAKRMRMIFGMLLRKEITKPYFRVKEELSNGSLEKKNSIFDGCSS